MREKMGNGLRYLKKTVYRAESCFGRMASEQLALPTILLLNIDNGQSASV
jgi:hypothetical protein